MPAFIVIQIQFANLMKHLGNPLGCLALIAFVFGPGFIVAHFTGSAVWILITPLATVLVMFGLAVLPIKRKITPQRWADQLEKHLLGTEGPYDWDDATSVRMADEWMENLRSRLADFDLLDTPQKREELRRIIETLRRGEIP